MPHTFSLLNIPSPCTNKCNLCFFIHKLHPVHTQHLFCFSNLRPCSSIMVPELEKPRVMEIHVRMDCNGCVQKIKKALHGITGIYDLYIDFPQQKLTIIGWADPEKIVKAIKKTRKTATICVHTEPTDPPAQPTEPAPEGSASAPDSANPPPPEAPPVEAVPPKDTPPEAPPPAAADTTRGQPAQPSRPKDVEEVHVIYHHPPNYGYRYSYGPSTHGYGGQGSNYPSGPAPRHEPPQPIYVTHSYNAYKPSPYVTEYEHVHPNPQYMHYNRPEPPQHSQYSRPEPQEYMHYSSPEPQQYMHYSRLGPQQYMNYSRPEQYEDSHTRNNGNGSITSIFSDENPNACTIV